jgi:hypothetical protein
LEIQGQTLNEAQTESFLACLDAQSTICKLSLLECSIDDDAMLLLKRFMGKHKEGDISGVPALTDLTVDLLEDDGMVPWSGSTFASMFWMGRMKHEHVEGQELQNSEECPYPTIGSHIRSLTLSPVSNGGRGFLRVLARNAHRIELTKLSLYCLDDDDDCKHLARYIAKTRSLQELDLSDFDNGDDDDYYPILCSLQTNGTVHTVTIPGEVASRLANSFCLRNKLLGQLLQNLVISDQGDKAVDSTQTSAVVDRGTLSLFPSLLQSAKHDSEQGQVEDRGTVSLVPSLLQSAKPIAALRTTVVVSGLLHLGESVGPT